MAPVVVTDSGLLLHPDPTRVVTRLFVAGREDVGPGASRATPVIQRLLDLTEAQVDAEMRELQRRFASRHRGINDTFREHAAVVFPRLDGAAEPLSDARLLLLGAAFTNEYAIEGAALCNPSAVMFPDATQGGSASFVLSVRGVGEGHRSSIGFRTGAVTSAGTVRLDPPAPFPVLAEPTPARHRRDVVRVKLADLGGDPENAAFVLDQLPDEFDDEQLTQRIDALTADFATRRHTVDTINNLRQVAGSSYSVEFSHQTALSERVLWPQSAAERHGMEDARFVRFTHDDGTIRYYATYTAFDGVNIAQHLLETDDFRTFVASPMAGCAAQGKGLALFPRKVNGHYVALSRADRESNSVAFSDDMRCWTTSQQIQTPTKPWELLQLGNCGSPIETDAGWLVITHGVGVMRTYSLGAILLALDEPQRVLATSDMPIIGPGIDRRDGYVPNVVYSCGGFAHGDVLVLPYGIADQRIAIATMSISELIRSLRPVSRSSV